MWNVQFLAYRRKTVNSLCHRCYSLQHSENLTGSEIWPKFGWGRIWKKTGFRLEPDSEPNFGTSLLNRHYHGRTGFYCTSSCAGVVLAVVILSVWPSVCHLHALWQNRTVHCGYFDTTRKGNHSSSLTPTLVGGWRLFPFEICAQNDPPPFDKGRLRQISTYNISIVRDNKKVLLWWIESQPQTFQQAIDGVCTLPLSPSKGGTETDFVGFLNKIQFQSNKVGYKDSLCENFEQHSCSITISPSIGP